MTPPLQAVALALRALDALPHVAARVSDLLMPRTIDRAVYCELPRVLRVFARVRPQTAAAMDGACARGLLPLAQRLHAERAEGCTAAAFEQAARGGHLHVLRWLHETFPATAAPTAELLAAAAAGHVDVLLWLQVRAGRQQVELALEAAAAAGHVAALEAMLRRPYSMRRSLLAAATHGRAQVVRFLLARGYNDRYGHVNPALVRAAERGHCDVVALLLERSDDYTVGEALTAAAADGRTQVVELLLDKRSIDKVTLARALEKAAASDRCDVAALVLDKLKDEAQDSRDMHQVNAIVDLAFELAVENGRINVIKLLIDVISTPVCDILVTAAANNRLEVLEFMLNYCMTHQGHSPRLQTSITAVAETAAWKHYIDVAKLVVDKCASFDTGRALGVAVKKNDSEMVHVFVETSSVASIQDAVVKAAVMERDEILAILLEYSSSDTVEKALVRVEALGKPATSKLLLTKCESNAYSRIFDNAAVHGLVGLVSLLLDKMNSQSIRCGLISAAIYGHTEVVRVLMDECDSTGIMCAFEMAALRGRLGVVELLRDRCEASSVRFAISAGDALVGHLLRHKRARYE